MHVLTPAPSLLESEEKWGNLLTSSTDPPKMPSDDIKTYATSNTDFYEILGVSFETSQKDIDRAWRRTALKYHPDKVRANDTAAKEKFHLAQIGYDLLSDPSSKALYDAARNARLQRQRQNELFEGRRRQMKDELETRERGVKRARNEGETEEEALEREIRRLAEDGKRRRKEREEALRREVEREAKSAELLNASEASNSAAAATTNTSTTANGGGQGGVSELDRTIKVRWSVDDEHGTGTNLTADRIKRLFSSFGKIESADLLAPKMLKLHKGIRNKSKKKQLVATCMLQFASVVGAHAAVIDFPKLQQQEGKGEMEWQILDSASWAVNRQPEFLAARSVQSEQSGKREGETKGDREPATTTANGHSHRSDPNSNLNAKAKPNPFAHLLNTKNNNRASTPTSPSTKNPTTPKPNPSFSSFSPSSTTHGSNTASEARTGPSLEEVTLIRLKEAEERRRLGEDIRRREMEMEMETGEGG